jgi:hypothetical protein
MLTFPRLFKSTVIAYTTLVIVLWVLTGYAYIGAWVGGGGTRLK